MNEILDEYGRLLHEVDEWFRHCLDRFPEHVACRNGCSECCRGLFDITLLDAEYLKRGFDKLPEPFRTKLAGAATRRLEGLTHLNSAFVEPWLLNGIPEEEWEVLMPEEDETPCLLLSETGACLVYDYRPMTCRLNGIPLIDSTGEELFDEWCTLNFTKIDPRKLDDLRFAFKDLFARELILFQQLVHALTGIVRNEVDIFIPAAVVLDNEKVIVAILDLQPEYLEK